MSDFSTGGRSGHCSFFESVLSGLFGDNEALRSSLLGAVGFGGDNDTDDDADADVDGSTFTSLVLGTGIGIGSGSDGAAFLLGVVVFSA